MLIWNGQTFSIEYDSFSDDLHKCFKDKMKSEKIFYLNTVDFILRIVKDRFYFIIV